MDYRQVIEEIFRRRSQKSEEAAFLSPLCRELAKQFRTIHVGGTNGKGQVSAKIAAGLEAAGYRVGLYTSPHLFDYAERISINGKNIPHEQIMAYYKDVLELENSQNCPLFFFSLTTWFAFRYFAKEKVDYAVIEVGIGGRRDETNVITPELSVITSISLDHTALLGESLEEIAYEKAGIIKEGVPVVVGPNTLLSPIIEEAKLKKAPLYHVQTKSALYEEENRAVAAKALEVLGIPVRGIEKNLPCRFERVGNVIFDVAHNPDAFARLRQALQYTYPDQKFRFVIGICNKKDGKSSIKQIASIASHIHFVASDQPDSSKPEELVEICLAPCSAEPSVAEGMQRALAEGEKIVICGTFYIMLAARESLPSGIFPTQDRDPHLQSQEERGSFPQENLPPSPTS